MEEQYSKVKTVLSEYSSWKALSSRDALENYSTIHSRLSSVSSMCSDVTPHQLRMCPKLSFEMNTLSEMVSFGHLGKISVGEELSQSVNVARDSSELLEDLPPNRKRKKIPSPSL